MSVCEEEATEEAEEEKAAGAELKTKTPHNDVGKNGDNATWTNWTNGQFQLEQLLSGMNGPDSAKFGANRMLQFQNMF